MNPEQAIDFALKFTGPISPWWLLLLLPVALGAAWTMYRRELPVVERPHRIPLLLLRLTMLAIVVLLVFQPQLVRRLTLTYSGRTVFVLDDSRSMAARDSRLSDAAALRLARSLQPGEVDAEAADPLVVLIGHLETARAELRAFQRYAADADRERDAFWNRVDQSRSAIESAFDEASQLLETTARAAGGLAEQLQALRGALAGAREAIPGLFTGQTDPPTERYDEAAARIDAAIAAAIEAQAAFDRLRIAADDEQGEQRADRARRIKNTARFELVQRRLAAMNRADGYQLVRLSDATELDWPADDATNDGPGAEASETDLVGGIDRIIESPSDFPLQSIVLLSDGRNTTDRRLAPVIAKLARQGVPIIGAGAGATDEPIDLAVTDLTAAPIGVVGQPMTIRVGIKSAPAEQIDGKLSLLNDAGESLQTKEINLTPGEDLLTDLQLTAEEPGLQRLTVSLERVENEAFPTANNSADLVVNILEQPLRVLMLDHRPRWQTRFILNILKRLPYVDLNGIVLTTRPDGELKRGVERGMWPEDETALGTYDLVILGDLPVGTLTVAEREAIDRLVREQGKTLLTLSATGEQPLERLAHLAVSNAGAIHPVTMPLARALAHREIGDRRILMVDGRGGAPLLECRFDGKGRRISLNSDRFWKPLNPRHLVGHTRMFVEMFTWAAESGQYTPESESPDEQPKPRLILDQRRSWADTPLAVGVDRLGDEAEGTLAALLDEEVVAESEVRDGAARFDQLPAGAVRFKLADHEAPVTPAVQVVDRSDELDRLARDADWLASVSEATGGRSGELAAIDRLLTDVEPRQRVERHETIYRLWDATLLMVLLVVGLTVEWVWRKLTGLV